MPLNPPTVTVQVIIPARNEEDCIGRCLNSLAEQKGISCRITVVDDGSTDSTRRIAGTFPGVQVISAGEPQRGVSGKCNALIKGAQNVDAEWLLFTDADTFHYPGSMAEAVKEAEERGVDLLSYSPEQEVVSRYERMLMPVVYAELTRVYPTDKVNDPADPTVAANGQYILVRRTVYQSLGGHQAVAYKLLEDVELARIFKQTNHKIWFSFGEGKVRTRMYRSFSAMWVGWTKNLVLLFQHPLRLAAARGLEFMAIIALLSASAFLAATGSVAASAVAAFAGLGLWGLFLVRIRRAHFSSSANLLALFGLPFFSSLLIRSWLHSKVFGAVTWKGRKYSNTAPDGVENSSIQK